MLVNNAGTGGRMHSVVEADPELWRQVLDVNVLGPVRLCSLVLPGMVARGRGYVVNMTSLQGSRAMPGCGAYGASKAALMRLTDTMAGDLAGTGVVVFDVSPGRGADRDDRGARPGGAAGRHRRRGLDAGIAYGRGGALR